ncbi:protein RRP5 homolog [Acropora millepora]|uniref:protein RRP5 homolog n=1 Tax=Acropora millepora TaxID=45264 RepID=UPI001CF0F7EE|nr:protein RRP5 homolog [Acropora millepora]
MEEDFPRGGASVPTHLEVRQIRNEAERDVLFENSSLQSRFQSETKTKKKKKTLKTKSDDDDKFLGQLKQRRVEFLTFKKLYEGMKLLGAIKEVNEFDLVVSLPNGLHGFIHSTHINEKITEKLHEEMNAGESNDDETCFPGLHKYFKVGSLVQCNVLEIEGSDQGQRKIKLSLDPKEVNSSLKKSSLKQGMRVEDHGYLISFGIEDTRAFLPKKNITRDFQEGHPLSVLLKSVAEQNRIITVSIDEKEIEQAMTKEGMNLKFSALLPGMLVKASITQVTNSGLLLLFLGRYQGSADILHLPNCGGSGKNLEKLYHTNAEFKCRLLFIDTNTKTAGVSLREDIVQNRGTEFGDYAIGDIIDDATVIRVDDRLGLLMELSEGVLGFTHISRVSDNHAEKLESKHKVGTTHRCRILNFNSLDGLATLTMEESVIEQPFLRYHDIKPGAVVKGEIKTLESYGMLVSLSDHIRGLCPRMHFADINLQHPERKFKKGKVVKCRVLLVKPDSHRLIFTHKKTLVKSTLPIIADYSDAKPGMSTHGFISNIKEYGCFVTFYNDVVGLAHVSELGVPPNTELQTAFYIGQVVLCHVIGCNVEKSRISLSFLSSSKPCADLDVELVTGVLGDVDVVESRYDGLEVTLQPSGVPGFLPTCHLSDHLSNCASLLPLYNASTRLSNVVLYGKEKGRPARVSLKPSLVKAVSEKRFVTEFSDLKVGMILTGVIVNVMQSGALVEFSVGLRGLAPNPFLADEFVSEPALHFQSGRSVLAMVQEIDPERQRFIVSLRPSDCFPEETEDNALELLKTYLVERQQIIEHLSSTSEKIKVLTALKPGTFVEAEVLDSKYQGIFLQLAQGIQGFVFHQLAKGVSCQPGEIVFGCVLDCDLDRELVYVSLIPDIVKQSKAAAESGKSTRKKLKNGTQVGAIVQVIRKDYIVVTLPLLKHRLCYAPAKLHLNDLSDASKRFAVGQQCTAYVRSPGSKANGDLPVVVLLEDSIEGLQPGTVTTGIISSVRDLYLMVNLCGGRMKGRVHVTQICDEVTDGEFPPRSFHIGDEIKAKVLGFRDLKTRKYLEISHRSIKKAVAELSMKPSDLAESSAANQSTAKAKGNGNDLEDFLPFEKKLQDYTVGSEVYGFVKGISKNCVWMMLSPSVNGRVSFLHASSDLEILNSIESHFKRGSGYKCVVLGVESNFLELSLTVRPGFTVNAGQVLIGRVAIVAPCQAVYIELPVHNLGVAFPTNLMDSYVDNPWEDFEAGQFVRCFVLAVKDHSHIDLSLRPSRTEGSTTEDKEATKEIDREIKSLDDLNKGDIVRGYVKNCSDVGVFVSLAHHIVARILIKNLSEYFLREWKPFFPVGKLVRGKVLSIDPMKGFIELSLKGSDVGGPDPGENVEEGRIQTKRKKDVNANDESSDEGEQVLKKLRTESDDENCPESEIEDEDEVPEFSSDEEDPEHGSSKTDGLARLQLSSGFDWSEAGEAELNGKREHESDDESGDSETEPSEQVVRKKSKQEKRAAKKAEEEFLYKTEQSLLDQDRLPETPEDFDRLVVSSPNNSVVWLQYMAYHLHTANIEKAKEVAERALKTISFREEQEKMNVWVGLMNLENLYGTQESLLKVFERALQQNEPKKMFFQLAGIYARTNKMELADQLYQTMIKRFSQSKKVWIGGLSFYMKQGNLEKGRKLLQRSLKTLPKRKHIDTIVQFALLEFKHGEPQRGQTMFESILTNYPKRSDLWSVYLDMMIKQGDSEPVRQIFERVIHVNMSSKKMKLFFKRYLDFERKHGDALSIEKVKTKAMEYVESKAALN